MPVLTPAGSSLSSASNPRRDDGDGRDDIIGTPPVSKISSPSTQSSRTPRIPRPHDEIRRVQRGQPERIPRVSLRQRAVILMKQQSHRPGRICSLYPTCKPPRGTRKCRIPRSPEGQIPPIAGEMSRSDKGGAGPAGPHDTLQPPDESIIVGYYTLKKCRSLRSHEIHR